MGKVINISQVKNKSQILATVTLLVANMLVSNSVSMGTDYQNAMAKEFKKFNNSTQDIVQGTLTGQEAVCEADGNTLASCNNVGLSFNLNDGNNAAGQQ